jgi:peroxin-3
MEKVTTAVKEIFGPLNPRDDITLEKLSELTVLVRKRVEGFTDEERKNMKWLPFLLPPLDQEDYVLQASGMTNPSSPASSESTPFLRRLLDETSDLIDSPVFTHVLTLLLDSSFSLLIDNKLATLAFKIPPTSESTARVQEIVGGPEDQKCKVANTLAIFCRQAHSIGSGSTNEYLAAMEEVRDLEAFAAVVYSSNFEFEAPEASATNYVSSGVNGAVGTTTGPQNSSDLSLPPSLATTRPGTSTDVDVTPASLKNPVDPQDMPVPSVEDELEKAWENAFAKEAGQRTQ